MKYVFTAVVIVLIGLAVYMLYKNNTNKKINVNNPTTEIITSPEINIGITGFDTINPILSKSKDVQYLSKLIYRSLVKITPDFQVQNDLAEEWPKLNDTSYLIKLKDNITWNDGSKFTAKDVEFTINGIKNFTGDSIYKDNVKDIASVQIIDDYTLKINLDNPVPFFEYMLSFPILSADGYDGQTLKSKSDMPISTGEYAVSSINDDSIVLKTVGAGLVSARRQPTSNQHYKREII